MLMETPQFLVYFLFFWIQKKKKKEKVTFVNWHLQLLTEAGVLYVLLLNEWNVIFYSEAKLTFNL